MAVEKKFNEEQDQNSQGNPQFGASGSTTPTPAGGSVMNPMAPKKQGSGRFSNIQKYLGANEGATQRLSEGLQSNLTKKSTAEQEAATSGVNSVAAGIQAGKAKIETGKGYQNQLNSQNFDAAQIANDQNKYKDFLGYKAGKQVDVNDLQNRQTQAITSQQQALKQAQERAQQVGTEEGRFSMLDDMYGGPKKQYTQGQKSLDQLFLQAGGGDAVSKLQDLARSNVNQLNTIYNPLSQYGQDISGLTTEQQEIAKALGLKTTGMEKDYITGLESKIPGVNEARTKQRQEARDFYDVLMNLKDGTLDSNLMNEVQLRDNEMVFNALKGLGSASDIWKINETDASRISDVATQGDVDKYSALAKLAFGNLDDSGQVQFDPSQMRLTESTPLEAARQVLEGKNSLRGRIDQAQGDFMNRIRKDTIKGSGTAGSGSLTANASANIADVLDMNGPWQGVNWGRPKTQSEGTHWADPIDMAGRFDRIGDSAGIGEAASGITDTSKAIGDQAGEFVGNVIGTGFDPMGGSGARMSTAQMRAENNLLSNLAAYLDQAGAYNIVNSGGATKGERGDWRVDGATGADWLENFNIGQSTRGLPKGTAIKGGVNIPGGGQNRAPLFTYLGDKASTMNPSVTEVISAEEMRKRTGK